MGRAGFEVDVEGSSAGERLVRSDSIEELPVAFDVEAQVVPVVDLVTVEMLVLERAEGALANAVLAGALSTARSPCHGERLPPLSSRH